MKKSIEIPKWTEYDQKCKDMIDHPDEQAYRRGYSQGFNAARNNPDISIKEVYAWKDNLTDRWPPGSHFDLKKINTGFGKNSYYENFEHKNIA